MSENHSRSAGQATQLQTELERNLSLLRHLASIYDCFGLANHADTIYRTAQRVEESIEDIRVSDRDLPGKD